MKRTVTFVIGATASGKTTFIQKHFANKDVVILNVFDYQQAAYKEAGFSTHIPPLREQIKCLHKANENLLADIIALLQQGKNIVVEQTLFKAKRRIRYVDAIRNAFPNTTIEVYVRCPSDSVWETYINKRKLNQSIKQLKETAKDMQFPNPSEGFDRIYEVTDDNIRLRIDPPKPEIIEVAHKELQEEERIYKEKEVKIKTKKENSITEIIASNYTRKKFEEIGFCLSDFQKATLIWNKPNITRQERHFALTRLAIKTENANLLSQIFRRVEYENKIMDQFQISSPGETLYVVINSEGNACGYFGKYETALSYTEKYINKGKTPCSCVIEKHKIVNGDTIPLVKSSFRINPNFSTEKPEELVEYSGEPVACLYLNENGNITKLWSNELDNIENSKVDEYRKERFEYQFLALPYVHHEGFIVKYIPNGEYGVIKTSKNEWNCFLERINKGLYADYFDTALVVYFLTEKGSWTHRHCNPIYLEVEMPVMDIKDEKQCAFCRAMDAMSDYMGGRKDEAQEELVLKTTREYAIACEKSPDYEQSVKDAKRINDILC